MKFKKAQEIKDPIGASHYRAIPIVWVLGPMGQFTQSQLGVYFGGGAKKQRIRA